MTQTKYERTLSAYLNGYDFSFNSKGEINAFYFTGDAVPQITAAQFPIAIGCEAIKADATGSVKFTNVGTNTVPVWSGKGTASISLTSAQIRALFTTPVTVVAGITGKTIAVESYSFVMTFGSVAYTGSNAIEYRYTNGSGAKVASDTPSTVINVSSGSATYPGVGAAATGVAGAPVVVAVPTANPGAGDGTAVLTINYRF